ncbi:MAG: T9SS type A sorting domain-containing protein, partial [Hymenobacter sp.]
ADDVLIPGNGTLVAFGSGYTVTTQPTVTTSNAVGGTAPVSEALSVTLSSGAVLTLANNGTLNVYGDFVNTDSQVQGSGTGTLNLLTDPNGNAMTHDLGGNVATTFPNLSVSTGITASTSQAVAITRALTVAGNLAIGTSQSFTLLSSSVGTAYLVNSGSGTVSGTATVQRYITPTNSGLGYRHYSSPVSGNTVADFATAGFTPVVNSAYNSAANPRQVRPYPTVFTYDQSRLASSNASYAVGDFDNGFLSPDNTSSALTVGQGYTVNIGGTQLVDFQGPLNQATSYSRTGLARGAQTSAGFHLLGNPYPGAISYTTLYAASSGVQDGLYVYKSSGQYVGSYSAYLSNGQSTNGGSNNIPLGQGFFLRVAAGQTGSVNFPTSARTNSPETALFQRSTSTAPSLAMTLSGSGVANQTRIYFDASATPAFDNGYDANYLPASHGLDLASDISTEALAINGLPELTGTVTVPLQLHATAAGTYTLAVDELDNLPTGYHAYLRDGRTGSYTDLAATPSLSLALAPADAPTGRYAVVFATSQPLASAPAALAALVGVYPNPARGTATLVLPQALRGQASSEVTLVNTLGQVVLRRTVAAGTSELVELPLGSLAAGIYTVRATTATGAVAKQLRVE